MTSGRAAAGLGLGGLVAAFARGDADPDEALDAYAARIAQRNGALNAFLDLRLEAARAEAAASRARWRAGAPRSEIDGAPFAVKANIPVEGLPCHAGIAAYRHDIAPAHAPAVAALVRLGAIPLGTVNMHEGALGATTDNPHFGRTGNPWDMALTPGGSSGGSAAAVAAGLCAFALGTDTMGSVRIPSAYCGIAGVKPTRGLIPATGLLDLSPTLDHVGVHAAAAEDLACVLAALAGLAPMTPRRIGILDFAGLVDVEADVAEAFAAAAHLAGTIAPTTVLRLDPDLVPEFGALRRRGLLISEAEGFAVHRARLSADRAGFSPEFAALLDYGARLSPERLAAARADIAAAARAFERLFESADVILAPTAPQGPFPFSAATPANQADFTCLANFGGFPAIAVPATATGAPPASVQFIAPRGQDGLALGAALAFERRRGPAPRPPGYFD